MRRRARTDANHEAVRTALRAAGWTIFDASRVGAGFPDLVALKGGRTVFVEVKDGGKSASRRRLTEDEARVHAAFAAAGCPVVVVETVEQVVCL